jgi:hypothetical protein
MTDVCISVALGEGITVSPEQKDAIFEGIGRDFASRIADMIDDGEAFFITAGKVCDPIECWATAAVEIDEGIPKLTVYLHQTEGENEACYDELDALASEKFGRSVNEQSATVH